MVARQTSTLKRFHRLGVTSEGCGFESRVGCFIKLFLLIFLCFFCLRPFFLPRRYI
jgi:hypothetical protein